MKVIAVLYLLLALGQIGLAVFYWYCSNQQAAPEARRLYRVSSVTYLIASSGFFYGAWSAWGAS